MNPRLIEKIGPYPVVEFLAEGGMAWVFKVEDPKFRVHRALKMLKPQAAQGDEFRRFESEAKMLARVEHPNLITIYDFGLDEATGCYYYTMTLVDGAPLSETEPVDVGVAIPIFLDVLAALERLHVHGIIHRDIKPGNILMMSDGRVLLGDLGIARQQDQMLSLTRTGMAIGSVQYMSPEQARGATVDAASDVFSIGLSLYQVLTGRTIYDAVDEVDASSGEQVLMYLGALFHSGKELRFQFPPGVSPAIQRVIRRACHIEPGERYANAGALRMELIDAAHAPSESGGAAGRRLPWIAAAVLLVAAGAAWWIFGRAPTTPTGPEIAPYYQTAIERVQDPGATVREKRDLLATLNGDPSAGATAVLLAASADEAAPVAVDAVKLLNERIDERVAERLIALLEADEFTVRAWAARGLGDAGWTAARPALEARLAREDRDPVRRNLQRALDQLGPTGGSASE